MLPKPKYDVITAIVRSSQITGSSGDHAPLTLALTLEGDDLYSIIIPCPIRVDVGEHVRVIVGPPLNTEKLIRRAVLLDILGEEGEVKFSWMRTGQERRLLG